MRTVAPPAPSTRLGIRAIPGVDTRYMAREDGAIVSLMGVEPRVLAGGASANGDYLTLSVLLESGRRVSRDVHRLICLAFHGEPPTPGMHASHISGDSSDNSAANLAWETPRENLLRKVHHGTHDHGVNNSRAHLTGDDLGTIKRLRQDGWTQLAIANHLGVGRTTVNRALTGARYGG